MKILLLEHNVSINNLITKRLNERDYCIDTFFNAQDALKSIDNSYSCFILGIKNSNAAKSLKLLKSVRDFYPTTPVVMLHVENDLDTKVIKRAYEEGCDDFLKKPFLIDELETKISKLLNIRNDTVSLGHQCTFDFTTRTLNVGSIKKRFSKKEARLLGVLFSHQNSVVSLETIKAIVWEGEYASLDSIRSLIRRLRQRIPLKCIETLIDIGYILKIDSPKHRNIISHENYKNLNFISA